MEKNRFFYFLCNEGSEQFLKEEIALFHPYLRFSFSMKGFLTFKLVGDHFRDPVFVFCRHFGEFIQKGSREELLTLWNQPGHKKVSYSLTGTIYSTEILNRNDVVYELIEIKEGQYYLGKFKVDSVADTFLGGWFNLELPKEAPSRAYLKILEGALKVGVQFKAGESALEIGSSPGGATFALLQQGLNVMGVDPGKMDEICLNHSLFKHYQSAIQDFDVKLIDKKIDWLLVDMNLAPEATLNETEKILERIRFDFKGAFITLKMTKLSLVIKIPFYVKVIRRLGFNPQLLTQLPGHRQEFLMFITPK